MSLTGSAVHREIKDAERRGAREASVRIRRELEAWAAKELAQVGWLNSGAFAAALNQICPEPESE